MLVATSTTTITLIVFVFIAVAAYLGHLSGKKQDRLEAAKNKPASPQGEDPKKEYLASPRS